MQPEAIPAAFAELLDFLPDAVVVCDRAGVIRYANGTTAVQLGWEPGALVGSPIGVLLPDRFRARHALALEAYFSKPRARPMGVGLELTALRKDGRELPVDIALAPLRVGGETFGIAVIRDLTERREHERRVRELATATEEIRHRDEVLAIASHELRTPVGSMRLQTTMLQRVAREAATELRAIHERAGFASTELTSIGDRVRKLEGYTRRLGRLIEQLLDSSHVRYGKLTLRPEEVDLGELAHEAVESLREELDRSGSTVTVHAESPVLGRWDPIRIEQVIANLVLNAAKFGEGRPIEITLEADASQARLSVRDQGAGIAPEDQQRIFEQFERAAESGSALGLGLGLFLARQIVEAHGGVISLRSVPGHGSTFTVELPREALPAE
jgi:PAS domain S-box-containing protein